MLLLSTPPPPPPVGVQDVLVVHSSPIQHFMSVRTFTDTMTSHSRRPNASWQWSEGIDDDELL